MSQQVVPGQSRMERGPGGEATTPPVPPCPPDEPCLDEALSCPTPGLLAVFRALEGDLVVLGAAGKMGPTLARMARRAFDEVGRKEQRVYAVARFSDRAAREKLAGW